MGSPRLPLPREWNGFYKETCILEMYLKIQCNNFNCRIIRAVTFALIEMIKCQGRSRKWKKIPGVNITKSAQKKSLAKHFVSYSFRVYSSPWKAMPEAVTTVFCPQFRIWISYQNSCIWGDSIQLCCRTIFKLWYYPKWVRSLRSAGPHAEWQKKKDDSSWRAEDF